MSSYLLTGVAGFIGSHLAKALLYEGTRVVGIDDFNDFYDPRLKRANVAPFLKIKHFHLVEGDIRRLTFLKELLKQEHFDGIIHLAARAGVRPSIQDPVTYEEVNVRGTLNLLECAKELNIKKFIFASSSSVYGAKSKAPFREDQNLGKPLSPYAVTKHAGELLCYNYHHLYGIEVTCLRYFTVYGPAQRPDMAIRKFTESILRDEEISVFGDGTSRRDYTYIDDAAQGTVKAIEKVKNFKIYNIGESQTVDILTLIKLIEKATKRTAKINFLPPAPGDVDLTHADISKARSELGYEPKVGLEEGVERFAAWLGEQTPVADNKNAKETPK